MIVVPSAQQSDLTLSERLIGEFSALWQHLLALPPEMLALNAALSLAAVLLGWLAIWAMRKGLCWIVQRVPGHETEAGRGTVMTAMRFTRAIFTLSLCVVTFFVIAGFWGLDLFAWTSTGFATEVSHTLLTLFIVLTITAVAFEASGLLISYFLTRLKSKKSLAIRRSAQIDTLGPIIRRTLQAAILIIGLATLLGQLGVQIAPLLAGAGVVGIAIGFGAQTLVKDFFTGFFLLIEDIVAVGDVITIGNSTGEVEAMTLRYISMRDFDGTLHVFPYSEAQIIHNLTKSFSRYVFDLPISLSSDLEAALRVIKETGDGLEAEAEWKPMILESIEVMGVDLLADFGAIIKARITTTPHERWRVGRELNRRLKLAFESANIALGHKGAYTP